MWDCDWFRRFESRYFTGDFFIDFEEMQEEIEDAFTDISDQGPKELIEDYQILKDVGVREFSSFVYRYSMTIEYNEMLNKYQIHHLQPIFSSFYP